MISRNQSYFFSGRESASLRFALPLGSPPKHFSNSAGLIAAKAGAAGVKAETELREDPHAHEGIVKLVFHVLTDEGIHPKIALVADRTWWHVEPDIRTPEEAPVA